MILEAPAAVLDGEDGGEGPEGAAHGDVPPVMPPVGNSRDTGHHREGREGQLQEALQQGLLQPPLQVELENDMEALV